MTDWGAALLILAILLWLGVWAWRRWQARKRRARRWDRALWALTHEAPADTDRLWRNETTRFDRWE